MPSPMRRLLFAIAFAALLPPLGCEQRFSSEPPPVVPEGLAPASSSVALDGLLNGTSADAGSTASDVSHAMTLTLCADNPQVCPGADPASASEGAYRVVFGSGRGAVRSRGQAMADLYKELRDRTGSGERLDAEPRVSDAGGAPLSRSSGANKKGSADNADPLAQCAFRLLDLVDSTGEVTLDVFHGAGSRGCRVSLGGQNEAGALQCLVQEPERERRFGR
jgi:hypothetical protein